MQRLSMDQKVSATPQVERERGRELDQDRSELGAKTADLRQDRVGRGFHPAEAPVAGDGLGILTANLNWSGALCDHRV